MGAGSDDPDTLRDLQADRVREEIERAREAPEPAEQRAHERRADKAAYLRDKLAEQGDADDDDG